MIVGLAGLMSIIWIEDCKHALLEAKEKRIPFIKCKIFFCVIQFDWC